jgi:hypothetical protein
MQGVVADDNLPDGPAGPPDGWNEMESELLAILDRTIADFKGDSRRVYLTGLSYGGFGAWNLAATASAEIRSPGSHLRVWPPRSRRTDRHGQTTAVGVRRRTRSDCAFAILLPGVEQPRISGHPEVRFTIEEDLGHLTWVRVYEGQDLYSWLLGPGAQIEREATCVASLVRLRRTYQTSAQNCPRSPSKTVRPER